MTRLLRCLTLLLVLLGGTVAGVVHSPTAVIAQEPHEQVDYEAWRKIASRAEEAIEAGRASTPALEQLRAELNGWRGQLQDALSINDNAIATVERQLNALGPAPEEGKTEDADVAAQREILTERYDRLRKPALAAELAYNQANGLIRGIDSIIRERQTDEVLKLGPSPLNPAHWDDGIEALAATLARIRSEVVIAWTNPVQKADTLAKLPASLALGLIGIILIIAGRWWGLKLTNWVLRGDPSPARWLFGFFVSLGSLLFPFAGVLALVASLYLTGLVGLHTGLILNATLTPAFAFYLARWLANRVFPVEEARALPMNLNQAERRRGRVIGALLGAVAAVVFFLEKVSEVSGWSDEASAAVVFPFFVVTGLLLWRLAELLRCHVRADVAEDGVETYRSRMMRLLSLALLTFGVAGPVMAAVGFFKLAHALLLPSLASLEILAVLLVLQRLVIAIYVTVTGNTKGASESLIPVLIGFILVLFSVPFFAMAWGVRPADLTELWTRLNDGVSLGDTVISPTIFFTLVFVFALGYMMTRLIQGALKNTILPRTGIDVGGRNAIVSGVGYLGIFLAGLIAITSAGIDLSSIALVAGALSVGIGFGLRTVVENFVSGIILLIERPISEGDWIEVGGTHGTVRDISVRSTRIETFDRSDVILPNADLVAGRVTNYTRGNTVGRVIVPVGVAYGTDTRRIEKILMEVAESHPMVLANPAPFVVFQGFGASSLDFEIRAILRDVNWVLTVRSDMNHEIARRFAEEDIEIPFPQQDLWLRNPEAIGGKGKADADTNKADVAEQVQTAHLSEADVKDSTDDAGESGGDADGDGR